MVPVAEAEVSSATVSQDVDSRLIAALVAKQGARSNKAFAQVLGVDRSGWNWSRVHSRPRDKVVLGALRAFPDLQPLIVEWLTSQAEARPNGQTTISAALAALAFSHK